jgi:16S rRNA (guanine527-N7)-methyltransferase
VKQIAGSAGIAELADRFGLPSGAGARLERLRRLLTADPHAPTSVRDPRRVLDDHLADSLVALDFEELRAARRVVDAGSGAGVPGLPLAISLPTASFVLVESSGRKAAFIAAAAADCELANVEVVQARIESWAEGHLGAVDAVLARALAPLEVVVEYAAPTLRVGGSLIAWRGRRDVRAEERAAKAADLLGLRLSEVRRVQPYPAARDRYLHVFLKVMDTPAGFPRRPGMAAKRPLGGPGRSGTAI